MRKYGLLKAIFLAFFSRSLYRDVVKNWGACTLVYLLLVLALCWAVMMVNIQPTINKGTTQFVKQIVPQLPTTIVVKNGIVTTALNQPYYITSSDKKTVLAVIDTSGKYQDLKSTHANVLITKDSIAYLDSDNSLKIRKISSSLSMDIQSNEFGQQVIKFTRWLWLLLFPLLVLSAFIYRLFESLFYAVIGKIFAGLMAVRLHYLELARLSIVALTPAIIVGTIINRVGIWFHYEWLFYFILSMGYLIFAIGANKEKH